MNNSWTNSLIKLLAYTAGVAVANGFVMWIWNMVMPDMFGCKPIGYWQMCGLYVIGNYLFKNHRSIAKDSE